MPTPLKGEVEGMPGSWARIDFLNGQPAGLIYVPGEGDAPGELWELRQEDGQTTVALFGERANLQFGPEPGPMCGVLTPPDAQRCAFAWMPSSPRATTARPGLRFSSIHERMES